MVVFGRSVSQQGVSLGEDVAIRQGMRCQIRTRSWERSKGRAGKTARSTRRKIRLGAVAAAIVIAGILASGGRRVSAPRGR